MPGGVAARSAGWDLRRNLPGPFLPAGSDTTPPFPQSPLPLAVDLFMFGNWVDVTRLNTGQAGVYARDGITITRGKRPEGTTVDPTEITLTLNNRDGRYSPRNPTSILYGQIGRNTPLRVRVGNDVRGVGEVSSWPSKWDLSGSDVWVPVTASGILRRLGQGASPLRSPMYRRILSDTVDNDAFTGTALPVEYWPCEEESGATQIASAVSGSAMTITGSPEMASSDAFPGSDSLPVVAGSRWTGNVRTYPTTNIFETSCYLQVGAGGITDGAIILRVRTTGSAARWDVRYNSAAGGTFTCLGYDAAGVNLVTSGALSIDGGVNGVLYLLEIQIEASGADADFRFEIQNVDTGHGIAGASTAAGKTVGRVTTVQVGPDGNAADVTVGHITVWSELVSLDEVSIPSLFSSVFGFAGESAGTRIRRLCEEEGIEYLRVPPSHTSTSVGAQQSNTLVDLLQECADADGGILFEPRTFIGLAFLDRQGLYDRAPSITLDYPSHQMAALEPVEDDRLTRNDVTAQRTGGSSARQVLETGALSVQPPPDGVGRYDEQVTINVLADTQLPDQAGWRLHVGTVDEARYPTIAMNLANPAFTSNPTLTEQARALDIGQRLDVTTPPAWLPPDDITQGVQGMVEQLSQYEQTITANLTPDSPWQVAVYDNTTYRYSSDGSTLVSSVDSAAVSLSVATPSGPLWTVDAGDMPFDIKVGGERITVTAISGAASPQTFTVTRSVNGVVKPQPAAAAVELWQPAIYAL